MSRQARIEDVLTRALSPVRLTVVDDSERHHGHGGWREGGETHYQVEIEAEAFKGRSRLARHRQVMDLLAGEFSGGLHALAITARAPGE